MIDQQKMKLKLKSLIVAMLAVGMVACGSENENETPVPIVEATPNSIELSKLSAYESGVFAQSAAEIPALMPRVNAYSWSMPKKAYWMYWI